MSKKEETKDKKIVETPSKKETKIAKRSTDELSRGFDSIFDNFRQTFDDFMAPFLPMRTFLPEISSTYPIRAPLIDIVDKGESYVIRAELPGFNKETVDVELNKDTLILKAEKEFSEEESSDDYLHRERAYTTSRRRINFPQEVNPEKVEAKMADGVLEIKVDKREKPPEEKMRRIELD